MSLPSPTPRDQAWTHAATLVGSDRNRTPSLELCAGDRVGRYQVLHPLGAGGMGVVFAAHDPELDRRIALKLVHPAARGHSDASQRRLLREAQAMARVVHPNVITVNDVGCHEGSVFLAMTLIEGPTLREWLAQEKRRWREVLDRFVCAGRGLAAVHEAGLVHRDFKPDNVMLDCAGAVRLMDFGLVTAPDNARPSLTLVGSSDRPVEHRQSLTQTGAMIGTLGYMAPEHPDGSSGPRADQFSFCVALYEGLYGKRPFAAETMPRMVYEVSEGRFRDPPVDTTVPSWLRKVVLRGLAAKPADRWSSMQVLLEALTTDPTSRWRRWAAWTGAFVSVAAVFGAIASASDTRCRGAYDDLSVAWGSARKPIVRAAVLGVDAPYVSDTWETVEQTLDDYARAWGAHHRDACESTHVARTQSEQLLDLRMVCLDRGLRQLQAVVDVLEVADAGVVEHAVDMVSRLPSVERCADESHVRSEVEPPGDDQTALEVGELRSRLARANALRASGNPARALDLVRPVLQRAEQLGYEPLVVEAEVLAGWFVLELGRYEEAEGLLAGAYDRALRCEHHAAAARATARLSFVLAEHLGRPEEALIVAERGRALLDRFEPMPAIEFTLALSVATVRARLDEREVSIDEHRYSLSLAEAHFGTDSPAAAVAYNNLGTALNDAGRWREAAQSLQRALTIQTRAYGGRHPWVAATRGNLAVTFQDLERLDDASRHLLSSLDIFEAAYGPDHPAVAHAVANLGVLRLQQGRLVEAVSVLERAANLATAIYGQDDAHLGSVYFYLGRAHRRLGRHREALELNERALAIHERSLGPDHWRVTRAMVQLAASSQALDNPDAAVGLLERAVWISEGQRRPFIAANARFELAQALWERNPERARALAGGALDRLEGAPDAMRRSLRGRIEGWLARHASGPA